MGDGCLLRRVWQSIGHGRLIDYQPVQAHSLDRLAKLLEVHPLLDVAVGSQTVTIDQVALFFRRGQGEEIEASSVKTRECKAESNGFPTVAHIGSATVLSSAASDTRRFRVAGRNRQRKSSKPATHSIIPEPVRRLKLST